MCTPYRATVVYVTYDSNNCTWNVMDNTTGKCLFYGTIDELEEHLNNNNYIVENDDE